MEFAGLNGTCLEQVFFVFVFVFCFWLRGLYFYNEGLELERLWINRHWLGVFKVYQSNSCDDFVTSKEGIF